MSSSRIYPEGLLLNVIGIGFRREATYKVHFPSIRMSIRPIGHASYQSRLPYIRQLYVLVSWFNIHF